MEKIIVRIITDDSEDVEMTIEQAKLLLACDTIGYDGSYYGFEQKSFEILKNQPYALSLLLTKKY